MKYLCVLQPTDLKSKGDSRMPLGLPYINGALRARGFDVEAINLQYVADDPLMMLKNIIIQKHVDVVLCGGITIEYPLIKAVFDAVREVKPDIITVGGGGGFSSEPELFSEMTGVDYAIIGEGEITVCELADALDNGCDTKYIKGLMIRKKKMFSSNEVEPHGTYYYTGDRAQIQDLDTVALPSYEGLDVDKYLDEQTLDGWYHTFAAFVDDPRIMPILMSRSCPFMCTFCYHPIGRGYRVRSMDSFFEELELYIERYHINAIALVDECFSIKPERVEEFCKRIRSYHIYWSCQMRVETYSESLLRLMTDSGCVSACFGLESMSQTILDDMNKKATVSQMENALEIAYRNKGGVVSNILFGARAENSDTVRECVEWVEKNPRYTINDFVMIGAYPGSGYYEYAVKNGMINDKKKFIEDGCPPVNLTNMPEWWFLSLVKYSALKRLEIRNKGEIIKIKRISDDKYEAILRCKHCGHVNHYKGISSTAYENGYLRNMVCRKCRNYSDYVFSSDVREKWNTTYWLYDMIVGNKNDKLANWIEKNSIANVAVYGLRWADIVIQQLNLIGVNVKYGIDRNFHQYKRNDFPVFGLIGWYENVDAIIVVATEYFQEIFATLKDRTDVPIYAIEEVLS